MPGDAPHELRASSCLQAGFDRLATDRIGRSTHANVGLPAYREDNPYLVNCEGVMKISSASPAAAPVPRPGRSFTVASYALTAVSFAAPMVLSSAAIAFGLVAAAQGDRAGRTAAVVAGAVLILQTAFFVLWAFGVVQLP